MRLRKQHTLYTRWKIMRQRCNNPNSPDYKNYGGRGIKICARWDNFWNFVDDMYPSYTEGMTDENTYTKPNGRYEECCICRHERYINKKTLIKSA